MSDKHGLPLMSIFDTNVIITPSDIKFCEDFCPSEFVDKIRNKGERVGITGGMFIDVSIVFAGV